MMLFKNAAPRRFSLRPVYSDERKERLRAIEERARRELGMTVADSKPVSGTKDDAGGRTETAKTAYGQTGTDMRYDGRERLHDAFKRHDGRPRPTSWPSGSPVVWLLAAILAAMIFLLANTDAGREMIRNF